MVSVFKRILLGRPIATAEEGHQKLSKKVALPIFASDAMSSTAYATDEILIVLLGGAGIGVLAFHELVPIAIVVGDPAVHRGAVVPPDDPRLPLRRRGLHRVAGVNLGATPSLVAGASLLTDYILTVAVSIAGGVLAMQSGFGFSNSWRVPLCLVIITIITVANLRGLRESGALFAPPTYLYICMLVLLIGSGFTACSCRTSARSRCRSSPTRASSYASETKALSIMMFLRAFSSGAVALSGVEAVSNGVPDFKKPAAVNASKTLAYMAVILGTCFLGVSILASHLKPYRGENDPTGIALMAEYIYGGRNALFWITQIATFLVLVLAANTAYAGFPRLGVDHRPGRLPARARWPTAATSWCSPTASSSSPSIAGLLIVVFKGNITALIPLYAFGVFTGFTLSQAGMVVAPLPPQGRAVARLGPDQRCRLPRHRRSWR